MVRAEEVVSDHQSSVEGRTRLRYLANLTMKRHFAWYRETHVLNMWISAPRRCPPRCHQRHKAIPLSNMCSIAGHQLKSTSPLHSLSFH